MKGGPKSSLRPFLHRAIQLMLSNTTHPTWNSRKGKQRSENKAIILFIYLKLANKNKTAI